MKRRILQMLFIVGTAIFMSSVNVFADDVAEKQKIAMLENLASMGDQASVEELKRIRSKQRQQKAKNPQTRPDSRHSVSPANPFITVEASGVGTSYDEALRDAFKAAIRKVVGVYVITQTKTTSFAE